MFLVVVLAFACISVEGFSLFPLVTDGIRLKVTCRTVGHSACMMVRVSVTVRGWIMRSGDPSVSLVGLVMDLGLRRNDQGFSSRVWSAFSVSF